MNGQKKMELMTLMIVTATQTLLSRGAKHMLKSSKHRWVGTQPMNNSFCQSCSNNRFERIALTSGFAACFRPHLASRSASA